MESNKVVCPTLTASNVHGVTSYEIFLELFLRLNSVPFQRPRDGKYILCLDVTERR